MKGIGNDLVREARRRSGLTQRALGERAGTTQSAIARIETGRSAPSFDTVLQLLRLCGLDLDVMVVERDDTDWQQARELLLVDPDERLQRSHRLVRRYRELQGAVEEHRGAP